MKKMIKFIDLTNDPVIINPEAITMIDIARNENIPHVRIYSTGRGVTVLSDEYTMEDVVNAIKLDVITTPHKESQSNEPIRVVIDSQNSCDKICKLVAWLPSWMNDEEVWLKLAASILQQYKKNEQVSLLFEIKERGIRFMNLLEDLGIVYKVD